MIKEVILSLVLYINSVTGYPIPEYPVNLEFYSGEELCEMQHGKACEEDEVIFALYIGHGNIYLNADKISPVSIEYGEAWSQSVLLHELVHYFTEYKDYACYGDAEKEAYDIQEEWLMKNHGIDMYDYIDPMYALFVFQIGCGRF